MHCRKCNARDGCDTGVCVGVACVKTHGAFALMMVLMMMMMMMMVGLTTKRVLL